MMVARNESIASDRASQDKPRPIITAHQLVKTYGSGENQVTVLADVSFEIKQGEFVAIVGPSGSGKTTLMNILGALDTPTSGTYSLDGKLVSDLKDDDLAIIRNTKIGFVFQSFNLLPRATVERNIRLPLIYSSSLAPRDRKERINSVVEAAGLPLSKLHNRSNQLSGGQMQRVAIARALVNNPSIILADEPTGNLDQATGRIVINTFLKLNRQGRTIVLITHDLNIASNASRIIHIQDGKLVSDQMNIDKLKKRR
jgi:putative ABC transport system ATP-binding protein